MLTKAVVEKAVPANFKNNVTQQFVDDINTCLSDPIMAEQVQENFIHYTGVLKDGKFKMEDYLRAVIYVSLKLTGMSNQDAYVRTFPQRYADLVARGVTSKDISAYVSIYNKGKLVNLITEQAMIPTWVLNQHIFQQAINVQADLMLTAQSEKVRVEAANSILTHLKRPEAVKAQLDVNIKDTSGMTELKDTLSRLAQQQQNLITQGVPTREIAAQSIVDAEFELVTDETEGAEEAGT